MKQSAESGFRLHERLAADNVAIQDLSLCTVLLMKDARYPWVILVPRRKGMCEIYDLSEEDSLQLMREIRQVSAVLKNIFEPDKVNIGALGNIVSQLHIHIIARNRHDPAWPGPVWGQGEAELYESRILEQRQKMLKQALV